MIKEGAIVDYKNDAIVGDHEGSFAFYPGESNLKSKAGASFDKLLEVIDIAYSQGTVYVGYPDNFKSQFIFLSNMIVDTGVDLTKPLDIYVKYSYRSERLAAILHLKSNHCGLLELREEVNFLIAKNSLCVIYNKRGVGGKALAHGYNQKSGWLDKGKINNFPEKDEFLEDGNDDEFHKDIFKITF